ncbi:MAG: hypothetical protein IPG50_26775 [Myxococcales bacterium]|nr:hypothetical protein [Myxococcales bacterium]
MHAASNDWFTVRLARAVFGMAPSRRIISWLSEALVLATAAASLSRWFERGGVRALPVSLDGVGSPAAGPIEDVC